MSSDVLKDCLDVVVYNMPVNTAGKYMEMTGVPYDTKKFGTNCVGIAATYAQLVDTYGVRSEIIQAMNGPHCAVISNYRGEDFFIDPTLLHSDPIPLEPVKNGRVMASEALPVVNGRPSQLAVYANPHDPSKVISTLYIRDEAGILHPKWTHNYDLDPNTRTFKDYTSHFLARPRFSIKKIDPEEPGVVKIVELEIDLEGRELIDITDVGTGRIEGGSPLALANFAQTLLTTRESLVNFLRKARICYDQLKASL